MAWGLGRAFWAGPGGMEKTLLISCPGGNNCRGKGWQEGEGEKSSSAGAVIMEGLVGQAGASDCVPEVR